MNNIIFAIPNCPGGGIGRHTSLRGWRRQKRASSSLVLGTKLPPHNGAIAQMAELVDALVSGTSISNDVQVRVLFWAPEEVQNLPVLYFFIPLAAFLQIASNVVPKNKQIEQLLCRTILTFYFFVIFTII